MRYSVFRICHGCEIMTYSMKDSRIALIYRHLITLPYLLIIFKINVCNCAYYGNI